MDYRKLAYEFLKIGYVMSRSQSQRKINEMAQGELYVLNFLFNKGETALPSEISDEMKVSTARMATILGSLEKRNYIERTIDKNDRRKVIVSITEEGSNFVQQNQKIILDRVENLFKELGEKDSLEYVRITKKISEIFTRKNSN